MLHNKNLSQSTNLSTLIKKVQASAHLAISFFEKKMESDGSYGKEVKDISAFFKSPMLFISANKLDLAKKSLGFIQKFFLMQDGDLETSIKLKSIKSEYLEYWSYTNGWIIRAENHLNQINSSSFEYLKKYYVGKNKGFLTHKVELNDGITDVLTTAHHGLIYLEMQDNERAISAGNYLCNVLSQQSDIQNTFYLRCDKDGNLITQFNDGLDFFGVIKKSEPIQLHFMMGYPSAFLAILYEKTKDIRFMKAAKAYLDFSLSCNKNVYHCDFSHKLAWAASIIFKLTKEEKYLIAIEKISDYFISKQHRSGIWYSDADINTQFDQSAEIACWFLNIQKNLLHFINENYQDSKIDDTHEIQNQNKSFKLK